MRSVKSHSASGIASSGRGCGNGIGVSGVPNPWAALTRMSTVPKAATVRRNQCVHLLGLSHVAADAERPRPDRLHFVLHGFDGRCSARGRDDGGAFGTECEGYSAADSASAPVTIATLPSSFPMVERAQTGAATAPRRRTGGRDTGCTRIVSDDSVRNAYPPL